MTGTAIKELRGALAMSPGDFAQLLGVNPSTLYRWEAEGEGEVKPDPNATRILAALNQARAKSGGENLKASLGTALLLGGGLFALFKLLELVFSSDTSAPTPPVVTAPPGTPSPAQAPSSATDVAGGQKGGGKTTKGR
uniref:helix-turn-helix domain-containing protein n=1 Tax=Corallococcus coralloides TaxID=184914 RepID=UPI000FFE8C26|nr:helix-turn-helix domain-containing protein [Corallococcus coralloides]